MLMELANHKKLSRNVKFILFGNITKEDGMDFWGRVKAEGIEERFIVFDQFIPDEVFHSYLKALNICYHLCILKYQLENNM